ncbi:Hormone-sensitive lipase [Cricetulus griseus]|uniref:Hormone-sensitive lipase n=1 Tax=Cricetulus griseus TaxID=10029 RepID=G3I0M0_CRIGR|nr:Hormone-sensitive lipase [Cricetulus griseus]
MVILGMPLPSKKKADCEKTLSIGLVSFGEHYKRNETGLSVTASSLFTGGRFAIDPELRGAEFERIIQNLDVHFWKAFWNITEIEVLSSLANMASTTVRVSRLLSLPPEASEMPLTSDPKLTVTISPPLAHTGPGPVLARLISYDLREGQPSASPSRLLSLMDPLLPLSVLSKCVSAYSGTETEDHSDSDQKALGMMGLVQRDTSLFLRDLRLGASLWLNSFLELSGRKPQKTSVSTAAMSYPVTSQPQCANTCYQTQLSDWHTGLTDCCNDMPVCECLGEVGRDGSSPQTPPNPSHTFHHPHHPLCGAFCNLHSAWALTPRSAPAS